MINLFTGLPGNGKTLFAVSFVSAWSKRDSRPVFFSGIKLTDEGIAQLGWTEINAEEWYTAPAGAIVVIDEAQRVFRPRSHGKEVPKHVSELETHRHQGLDLVLITQHPMLIDNEVRRLAGNHRHIVRRFGMQSATIHEWGEVRQDCEKPGRRVDSNKTVWAYDKKVYSLYHSAELHTVKRSIPKRAYVLIAAPLLIGAAIWYVSSFIGKKTSAPVKVPSVSQSMPAGGVSGAPVGSGGNAVRAFDPVADARQYVSMHTPRVEGLPHTAPMYDGLTVPESAPVPVACIASDTKCLCYTQQGTRMNVRDQQCRDIAEFGFFQEFDPNGKRGRERTSESVAVLDRGGAPLPISGVSTADRGAQVSTLGTGEGYGVLGNPAPGVRVPGQTREAAPKKG